MGICHSSDHMSRSMSCSTPTRRLETSTHQLLKRVHMCTERSFERTPVRHSTSKRKAVQTLSSTLSSSITLLSMGDQTLVGDHTLTNPSMFSLDQTLIGSDRSTVSFQAVVRPNNDFLPSLEYTERDRDNHRLAGDRQRPRQ